MLTAQSSTVGSSRLPCHISMKMRWLLFVISMILGSQIIRYPVALQNFLRADGLLSLGQTSLAIEHYRRALILDPDFDQAYSMMAWAYELQKSPIKAGQIYEEGLRHAHNDELLYLHYAVFLWKTGNFKHACEVSQEALRLFPESRNVLRVYGNSLERDGRSEEALRLWLKYLEKYPDDQAVRNKIIKKH